MTTDQWENKNKPLNIGTSLSQVISLWNNKTNHQHIQNFAEKVVKIPDYTL